MDIGYIVSQLNLKIKRERDFFVRRYSAGDVIAFMRKINSKLDFSQ